MIKNLDDLMYDKKNAFLNFYELFLTHHHFCIIENVIVFVTTTKRRDINMPLNFSAPVRKNLI